MSFPYDDDVSDVAGSKHTARAPIQILPFLYVGNTGTASNKAFMTEGKFTHVFNFCDPDAEYKFPFESQFPNYQVIPTEDDEDFPVSDIFADVFEKLSDAKENKGKVFIFDTECGPLISAICISYMLNSSKKQDKYLPLKKAIDYIVLKDPILTPHHNFLLHLATLEEELFEEISIDLRKGGGPKKGGKGGSRGGRRR